MWIISKSVSKMICIGIVAILAVIVTVTVVQLCRASAVDELVKERVLAEIKAQKEMAKHE